MGTTVGKKCWAALLLLTLLLWSLPISAIAADAVSASKQVYLDEMTVND